MTNFRKVTREQARNLGFQRAGVDDLPQRRVGGQREQITRVVERPGTKRARISIFRHAFGPRYLCGVEAQHLLRERLILREKKIHSRAVLATAHVVRAEIGNIVATLFEVLVARGALLAIPALLVDEYDRGQNRELLYRH